MPSGPTQRSLALLFDLHPRSWTSREDQHLAVCRALQARGTRPVIVFNKIPPEFRRRYEEAGVIVEEANYKHGALQYFRRLRSIIRRHNVDTVDIEFFTYFDPIAWMARLCGVRKIVFTESNSGLIKARSWKAALLRIRAFLFTAPVKRFVAISGFVRDQIVYLGIDSRRVFVVHKGIDLDRYLPDPELRAKLDAQYRIAPDEIVLGTVTILRPFKHPAVIVQACATLAKRGVPFRLFVVGGGEMQPGLELLAQQLGIAERVHWLGYVQQPEKQMAGWDFFLLASAGEAFGFVLIEAMACGVPVVAAKSGAIPEIVEPGRTGELVPVLDPDAVAAAIASLVSNPSLHQKMSAACRDRVREHFSVESAVRKTLEVYDSMR